MTRIFFNFSTASALALLLVQQQTYWVISKVIVKVEYPGSEARAGASATV
tara:strand:- start:473 stop:622 length:150 start_codon:yes stop_codon:yes gene_type:complete